MATAGDVIASSGRVVEDTSAMAGAGITVADTTTDATTSIAADMTNATSIMAMENMAVDIATTVTAVDMVRITVEGTAEGTDTDSR